jgi:ribosomal protein S27E
MSPADKNSDDEDTGSKSGKSKFAEFECPDCNANNPCDPPFEPGDEVTCNYCGTDFLTKVTESGRLKLLSL